MQKPKWSVSLKATYSLPATAETSGLDQNFRMAVLRLAGDFLEKHPKGQALVRELEDELVEYLNRMATFLQGDDA